MTSDFVPVIDVERALQGDPAARQACARAIDEAFQHSGFLVLTGHGVDPGLIAQIHDITVAFFQKDQAWKQQWTCAAGDPTLRGLYQRPSYVSASSDLATPPDLCELFTMNRLGEPGVAEQARLGDAFETWSAPNIWPDLPTFRETWLRYYGELEALGNQLLALFAVALDLPEDFFVARSDQHITNLTANWYPTVTEPPLPGQLRKGQHSDWGTLTVLYEDGRGGLQVQGRDGAWIDAPAIEGAFVVNIGDLMAVWTNDRWVSTVHRVLAPEADPAGLPRLSLPYFHTPNWDAWVECLPTCQGPDDPPRHAPLTAGRYLQQKIEMAYA